MEVFGLIIAVRDHLLIRAIYLLTRMIPLRFHQIVLANSIQNLHSDSRLTDAIDDDSRNHFRTPISGTTR